MFFPNSFDPSCGVIEPGMIFQPVPGFPSTVVSVFSHHLFSRLVEYFNAEKIAESHDVDGVWPIYKVNYTDLELAFAKGRLGAPACVGQFEDILAMGGKRLIMLGNCGVLDRRIEDCGVIIPTAALRGEGTSRYYAPDADLIPVNTRHRDLFEQICGEFGYPFVEGITWTTDAFYRETPAAIEAAKARGAVCVEMECAAMQALCDFRGVEFFQFFYAGDNLDHSRWEPRSLSGTARLQDKEKIALLAFELAARLEDSQYAKKK